MPSFQREPLRRYTFRPYLPGRGPRFILRTWWTHYRDSRGQEVLGYELVQREAGKSVVLFTGEDFATSPLHAIDSVATAESLMGFLTLRPKDTDAEYFSDYTPEQLDFCSAHAESLSAEVHTRWCDQNGSLKSRYQ